MKADHRAIAWTLLLAMGACSPDEDMSVAMLDGERAQRVIGPGGGTITSVDSALTIAIPPGALEEEHEFFIETTDEPPAVFGPAYIVLPNPEVRFDITVTVRDDLPENTSGLTVGSVDAVAFEQGSGHWESLPLLRVDEDDKLVSGLDDGISIFYALLDDGA